MADTSQRVMNMVRRRIMENPDISNEELFAAAVQLEPEMRELNMRQFNARYPLQVRRWEMRQRPQRTSSIALFEHGQAGRAQKPAESDAEDAQKEQSPDGGAPAAATRFASKPRRKSRARAPTRRAAALAVDEAARREIRHRLMRFAETIAGAATIPDAIHSLSSIDEVVDEIVGVLQRG